LLSATDKKGRDWVAGIYISAPNQVVVDLRVEEGVEVSADEVYRAVLVMMEAIGDEDSWVGADAEPSGVSAEG
jgi:hypothetical protein